MRRDSQNIAFYFAVLLSTSCLLPTAVAQDGSLAKIKQDVRTPYQKVSGVESKQGKASRQHRSIDQDDDDDELGSLFFKTMFFAAAAPFWCPPRALQDDYFTPGYFLEYPYQDGIEGYMMIDPYVPREPQLLSLQARSEYAHDFDGLSRIGTRFLLDTTFRFGFESEVNQWRESLGAGNYDELWTGDANVFFRFAQSSRLQMRTGIGTNWLSDEEGSEHGFNFTYQADFMPSKPWVISTELDLGKLGESSLIHGRITTGLQWRRAECYVGYDYYQVGDVPLKGFVGGIRLWF